MPGAGGQLPGTNICPITYKIKHNGKQKKLPPVIHPVKDSKPSTRKKRHPGAAKEKKLSESEMQAWERRITMC